MLNDAAFLAAILENPDDDTSRLAYSDWLMEQDDPARAARGEFIQVQVLLANRLEGGGDPANWVDAARIPQLQAREKELLKEYGLAWSHWIASLVDGYEFRKGFIERISLSGSQFRFSAEDIFAYSPIRRVKITDGLHYDFLNNALLRRVRELDFSNSAIGDGALRQILESPNTQQLRWLDLTRCYITGRGINALAESPLLGQLEHLNLSFNAIGLTNVQTLLTSPHWGKLKSLSLANCWRIDQRASQFLTGLIAGQRNVGLLRTMLQSSVTQEREYTSREVLEFTRDVGQAQDSVAVLLKGLDSGDRKIRATAAKLLAQLGSPALRAVPRLVQQLFETSSARNSVAPALARLIPLLPIRTQDWLCTLANPLLEPIVNLHSALKQPTLALDVRAEFHEICQRRFVWWARIQQKQLPKNSGSHAPPEVPVYATNFSFIDELIQTAGDHAARHQNANSETARENGERREAAWLLARLTELLQRESSPKS